MSERACVRLNHDLLAGVGLSAQDLRFTHSVQLTAAPFHENWSRSLTVEGGSSFFPFALRVFRDSGGSQGGRGLEGRDGE